MRNDSAKIILPGEYIELTSNDLKDFDGEVTIEPHVSSKDKTEPWIHPTVSRVINGIVRIPNENHDPVHIPKSQQLAHVRPVFEPDESSQSTCKSGPTPSPTVPKATNFADSVVIDPDKLLTENQRQQFRNINNRFQSVY